MSLYKRGETWWIYLVHEGERVRRSTGTSEKREAQRIHDELKAELWNQKRAGHTLADALALWMRSGDRTRNEANQISHFLTLYPNRPISEITGHDIASTLSDKGPATANRIINIIRAALNLAKSSGLVETVPSIPRRKTPPGRRRFLTQEEWARLYTELPSHLQSMAQFAISTGLRQANVFGLRWSQVDIARKVAWVEADETKAGQAIGVPLNDSAIDALKREIGKHHDIVFTFRGKPISSVKTAWNKALARAGIDGFTWHGLRHTWASWHVQNGTPLAVLKELGGWASMDMVMNYAHLAPDHIASWAGNATPQRFTPQFTPQQEKKVKQPR